MQRRDSCKPASMGGTISDVAPTATAIAHRSELYQLLMSTSWKAPTANG